MRNYSLGIASPVKVRSEYTRLTTAFIELDRDVVSVVHSCNYRDCVLDSSAAQKLLRLFSKAL
jgi:hypothetical protein